MFLVLVTFLAQCIAHGFVALLVAHKLAACAASWILFAAIVDGMPAPAPDSSVAYRWLHASLNLLAGNVFRFLGTFFPRFSAVLPQR